MNRECIKLNSLMRTGYGNKYRPLTVYVDNIASYTEDREGYGEIRLNDGYVYFVRECEAEIRSLIAKALEREKEGNGEEKEPEESFWVKHQMGDWIYAKCFKCGSVQDARSKFCPECGKRMKEGWDGKENE